MAITRYLSPTAAPASSGTPRHRLRAVDRDEVVSVADVLPPGATWLPAPPHTVPALPGRPPMVGYLVLVPADQQPPFLPAPVPEPVRPETSLGTAAGNETGPGAGTGLRTGPAPEIATGPGSGAEDGERPVRIDPVRRTAAVDGRALDLTYLEFELLAHLVAHPHRVHTRDHLVGTVWGYGHVGDGRTVDVHVARLRRKLGAAHRGAIQTVRRVGYKYVPATGG
ncbi:winged helix-turn-helix domain-containing protein [Streptomyces tropicalis]|uniref:Winged helix-turn-helix domain-containing protein n=1 Tax=Streptomyces tropicalis TaxID=3034234 RepID=A0ABT5ZXU9_9ACTN|nr:winged helix-turn-helix transcriptional regulator [Streptomyces tropicalis]MDF3297214.1 winged helix-turn-helix domain-containing protein [Streptomyces tropicalis]